MEKPCTCFTKERYVRCEAYYNITGLPGDPLIPHGGEPPYLIKHGSTMWGVESRNGIRPVFGALLPKPTYELK